MNNNPNNNNRQPNEQPNRQPPAQQVGQPTMEKEIRAFADARGKINDAPATLAEFSDNERALLTNDNEALGLLNTTWTFPATTDGTTREARTVESYHRGGNYINSTMAQWYTTDSIQAVLAMPRANEIPNNNRRS